jgi:hypothetical protein
MRHPWFLLASGSPGAWHGEPHGAIAIGAGEMWTSISTATGTSTAIRTGIETAIGRKPGTAVRTIGRVAALAGSNGSLIRIACRKAEPTQAAETLGAGTVLGVRAEQDPPLVTSDRGPLRALSIEAHPQGTQARGLPPGHHHPPGRPLRKAGEAPIAIDRPPAGAAPLTGAAAAAAPARPVTADPPAAVEADSAEGVAEEVDAEEEEEEDGDELDFSLKPFGGGNHEKFKEIAGA